MSSNAQIIESRSQLVKPTGRRTAHRENSPVDIKEESAENSARDSNALSTGVQATGDGSARTRDEVVANLNQEESKVVNLEHLQTAEHAQPDAETQQERELAPVEMESKNVEVEV